MLFSRVKPLERILAEGSDKEHGLKRSLGPWALTAMGIGAIIGTGIFVLTGVASATRAGPSLTISFVVAGFVSALAALGEILAWIIGSYIPQVARAICPQFRITRAADRLAQERRAARAPGFASR